MRYIKSYNNTTDLRTDLAAGKLDHPYVAKINNTIDFNSITTNWENEYFTIIALTDGTISYSHKEGSNPMFYSINEGEWIETTVSVDISVSKNDMIRFKSNRGNQAYNQETFTSGGTAQFAVAGNLMSLVAGDNFATYVPYTSATGTDGELYCSFKNFFGNCKGLISAKNLIIKYCDNESFSNFFNGCTNLLIPPELPATTLAGACYQYMFEGCTSLTKAPKLPATTLADYCYSNMFQGCTSLTTAPELPSTTLKTYCYGYMFNGCTSLTTAPTLPATTLADGCYSGMFGNTNVLPDCSNIDFASSTVVASGGLIGLFAGTKVTDNDLERLLPKNDNGRYYLPATTLAKYCYCCMFEGCPNLTTAPELPATTLANSCYQQMFYNCTSLTTAPELPATTLADYCYNYMFCDCTKLNYIKMLATNISASMCLDYWVNRVSSTGTFVKNTAMTRLPRGTSGIPSGWTVQNA